MNWKDTHLELMRRLPVRTHEQQPDPELQRDYRYRGRPPHRAAATRARHDRIIALDREGLSLEEIAERESCTTTTVRNHLKARARHDVGRRRK
jgi:DNA-directed RNA polymerase specialized sigma24 family protein